MKARREYKKAAAKIGAVIQGAREYLGYSRLEMGMAKEFRHLDAPEKAIYLWETGCCMPLVYNLMCIKRFFESRGYPISFDELLGE